MDSKNKVKSGNEFDFHNHENLGTMERLGNVETKFTPRQF